MHHAERDTISIMLAALRAYYKALRATASWDGPRGPDRCPRAAPTRYNDPRPKAVLPPRARVRPNGLSHGQGSRLGSPAYAQSIGLRPAATPTPKSGPFTHKGHLPLAVLPKGMATPNL